MKIVLVAPIPPPYGGIANWSNMVSGYIKQAGDEVRTVNIAPKKRSTDGRTWYDRIVVSGIDMLGKNRELKRVIKCEHPDVIHMTTSGYFATIRDLIMLRTAKRYKVPTVYHLHFGSTEQIVKRKPQIWKLFAKAMRMAGVVAAIDAKTYNAIKTYAPDVNVVQVPNPLEIDKLPQPASDKKKQVVFLGWMLPTKGVRELIEAWNVVGERYPDYKMLMIGPGKPDQLEEYRSSVKVNNLEFTGELPHDQAMDILAQSEAFVLPSHTEGFPYSVMEAMALKAAVVATNVGAIPEMLAEDCGIVVQKQNIEQLVGAMESVLSNTEYREKLVQNAYRKATEQYAMPKVYQKYTEMWKQAIG